MVAKRKNIINMIQSIQSIYTPLETTKQGSWLMFFMTPYYSRL